MNTINKNSYSIEYETTNTETIIHKITVDWKNLTEDIIISDDYDNKPVLQFDTSCIDLDNQSYVSNILHHIILPNTLKVIYNPSQDLVVFEYIDNTKIPRDLEYDYYGGFTGKIPQNIKYSLSFFDLSKIEYLEKEFFTNVKYQNRYFGCYYLKRYDFYLLYKKSLSHYFTIYKTVINDVKYEYYLTSENTLWLSNIVVRDSRTVFCIPDFIKHENKDYKVVGLGLEAINYYEDINSIIIGENVEHLSLGFLDSKSYLKFKRTIPNIYLNKKVDYFPYLLMRGLVLPDKQNEVSALNIFVPKENKHLFLNKNYYEIELLEVININYADDEFKLEPEFELYNNINFINLNKNDYCLFQDNNITYLLNDIDYTGNLINYIITSNTNDVIIPDEVSYLGKQYQITSIESNAVKSERMIDKLIIGKNIIDIKAYAFTVKHTNELIFKGNKIKELKPRCFDINLEKDCLIFPSSITTLGEEFITGRINQIGFEKESKLTTLKYNCFGGIPRIYELVLPSSVEKVDYKALASVVNVSFEEGKLSLKEWNTTLLNPTRYQDAEYVGMKTDPYKVCYSSISDILHPDCEYVLNYNPAKAPLDSDIFDDISNNDLSMEEYTLLSLYQRYLKDNPSEIKKELDSFLIDSDLLYLNLDDDHFILEYNSLDEWVQSDIYKYPDGYKCVNSTQNYHRDTVLFLSFFYYLHHRAELLNRFMGFFDDFRNENKTIMNFISSPYLQYFLNKDQRLIKKYLSLEKNYKQQKIEFLGSNNNYYYIKVNNDVCGIEITENKLNIISNTDNEDNCILAGMFLKNNILLLASEKKYIPDYNMSYQYDYEYTILFDYECFNKCIVQNYYSLLLVTSVYDIINNYDELNKGHFNDKVYDKLCNMDRIRLKYYLCSLFDREWDVMKDLNRQEGYVEKDYVTNECIIDNLDAIDSYLLSEIVKSRRFSERELQKIINYGGEKVLTNIYHYQFYSEDFFIKNAKVLLNDKVIDTIYQNNNDWFKYNNVSKKVKMFLELQGIKC